MLLYKDFDESPTSLYVVTDNKGNILFLSQEDDFVILAKARSWCQCVEQW